MNWLHLLGDALIAGGAFFILTGGIGLLRMKDFFTRLHPAGLKDAMGVPLIVAGLACYAGASLVSLKLLMLLVFLLITSPTACHALARSALLTGDRSNKEEA